MNIKDRSRVIQYLIEIKKIHYLIMLKKEQKDVFMKNIFESFDFKWWVLCKEFNTLNKNVKENIFPAIKNILFGGRVK